MEDVATTLAVLRALARTPGITRAELGRQIGASRVRVIAALRELDARGLLEQEVEEEHGPRAVGRPALRISLAGPAACSIGLEIGRTELHAGLFDLSGRILAETREPIAAGAASERVLDTAAELVNALAADAPSAFVLGVGVAIAEPVDLEHRIVTGVSLMGWAGVDVTEALHSRTGLPVQVENDANAAALAEHRFGAGRGCANLLYLRLSRGVGAALILGHRLYRGATGIAGELGHVSVNAAGALCSCGNRGCLQTLAGPLELQRELATARPDVVPGEWIELARRGDRHVCRLVQDAGVAVGTVVAGAVNLLNPSRVVVGGELAEAGPVLFGAIGEGLSRHAISPTAAAVEVVPGALGARAAIRGAAAVQVSNGLEELVKPVIAA